MFVLYRYEGRGSLHVVRKDDWDSWVQTYPYSKDYTKIAEHEDESALISMARLANKGEQ